jgi:subtilisin family serine protease
MSDCVVRQAPSDMPGRRDVLGRASSRRHAALASTIIAALLHGASLGAQGPASTKASGIIADLVAAPHLSAVWTPRPLTDLERRANEVDPRDTRRLLKPLEIFVQLKPGTPRPVELVDAGASNATGLTIPAADVDTVLRLLQSEAVIAVELFRPPDIDSHPVRPFNRDARRSHFVEEFFGTYPGIDGRGKVAAVFDGGRIRESHIEFRENPTDAASTRVMRREVGESYSRHATHVAGTIGARGARPQARGMAPASSIWSFSFNQDLQHLAPLSGEVDVTNHSYGPVTGWDEGEAGTWYWWGDRTLSEEEDARFGKYTGRESALDALLVQPAHRRTLSFIAAGNDRNDGPPSQPISHYVYQKVGNRLEWRVSTAERRADGFDRGGIDTVSGLCLAKNVVCVGAVNDIVNASIVTTGFSAWGPADDGRVKPDLVANGQNLLSAADADDEAYMQMPGTSMASPVGAGIALLLGQQFESLRKRRPDAVELKAVLIHSAIDAGTPGPDPVFGWGAINALQAGHVVARTSDHVIDSVEVKHGETVRIQWEATGTPIRATAVWNDPPAPGNGLGLDDATPVLQNDVDVSLKSPSSAEWFPFALNRSDPLTAAVRTGPNRVDNVEVVDAEFVKGVWEMQISGTRLATGVSQRVVFVTSGLRRK